MEAAITRLYQTPGGCRWQREGNNRPVILAASAKPGRPGACLSPRKGHCVRARSLLSARRNARVAERHLCQPARQRLRRRESIPSIQNIARSGESPAIPISPPCPRLLNMPPLSCRRRMSFRSSRQAVQHGVKSATVYAAGVGDGTDPEFGERGRRVERHMRRQRARGCRAELHGRQFVAREAFPLSEHEYRQAAGGLGCCCLSIGRHMQFWVQSAGDRGVKFSYAVSTGNEIDLDIADYLNFFVAKTKHAGHRAVPGGHPPA